MKALHSFFESLRKHELSILRFALLLIIIFGASNFLGAHVKTWINPEEDTRDDYVSKTKEVLLSSEHYLKTDTDSKITFIEYIDLECPHCKKLHLKLQELIHDSTFRGNYIIRHFPLMDIHPHAKEKALILECVAMLGGEEKFFSFLDSYFTEFAVTIPVDEFSSIAEKFIPNPKELSSCVSGSLVKERVQEHIKLGLYSGVYSTPTLVVLVDGVFKSRHDLLSDLSGLSVIRDTQKSAD